MEYTEMIDKVKALAEQNRAAKTAEDKAEVRRQMDALKESDPRAFAVAVGYMAKITEQQTKDSTVKQRIQDIQMLVSWREIAHTYFGKSASWLYHKLDGIDGMVEWEVSPKKRRLCSVKHYARFQTAYVLLQTEYKMRLGLIIPHKTNILIL